jgi:6-phosphogluconolactonase
VFLKRQKVYRTEITAALISQGLHIAVLVYGKSKSETVHLVLEDKFDPEQYPAQLIHPEQVICNGM